MEFAVIGLAGLFFAGHALQWFFVKTKIPDLLILTAVGYVIGPIFGLVTPESLGKVGQVVSTLTLIVILYEAGLHLPTKELRLGWRPALGLSILSFFSISAFALLLVQPLVPYPYSFLVAFAVGSTSSAIVIPMMKVLELDMKSKVILALESAFTDILAIVFFLVALEAFEVGSLSFGHLAFSIGPKTLLAIGFGVLAAIFWSIFKKFYPSYTKMTFAGEAWALLVYGVATLIGFNGAMAVLSLGFSLANLSLFPPSLTRNCNLDPVSLEDMSLLKELTFLLKTFFFIYLGTLVSFQSSLIVMIAVGLVLAILGTRYLCARFLFSKHKYALKDTLMVMGMGPRGLACAVLATLPLQKGLPFGEPVRDLLFAVIPVSIFVTAVFIFVCENPNSRRRFQFLFPSHDDRDFAEASSLKENE